MGIKFFCDACGKKLNIKEELAGKKGRCPKCDAVIKIPKESKIASSEKKPADSPAPNPKTAPTQNNKSTSRPKTEDIESAVDSPPPMPSISTGAKDSADTITASKKSRRSKSPSAKPTDADPVPSRPAPEPPDPEPPEPDQDESTQDAFAANPDGRWFVRPVSGGQFGPAEPDVMKTWLKEGRVGRDSLVWCEGWEEWQNADEVFAEELGTASNSSEKLVDEPKSNPSEPQPANRMIHHKAARKKAKTMGIVLVVGLALVSIALAIVLFIVVNNAKKGSKNKDKKESANLSFELEKNHNQQFGHHRVT